MTKPFENDPIGNLNRINRITFTIGAVKTASHVVHVTGSKDRYEKVRDDSLDAKNIHHAPRNRYITEEN